MSRDYWRGEERELGAGNLKRLRCLARIMAIFLRVWGASWRVEAQERERLEQIRGASPSRAVLFALWHNRMLMLAYTHRDRGVQILRSSSRDGQLIAEVLLRLGYGAIAGSSSRGGASGLRRLVALSRRGLDCAVTVDGPRGPRGRLKPGILQLAALTGCPIVPVAISARRGHLFKGWDRTFLPWPGSRLRQRYGEAFWVQREVAPEAFEELRRELERRLRDFSDALDREMGREAIPAAPDASHA